MHINKVFQMEEKRSLVGLELLKASLSSGFRIVLCLYLFRNSGVDLCLFSIVTTLPIF